MELIATAAFGLEGLVKQELQKLGFEAKAEPGGARFQGELTDAFKANVWLACADRVMWVLAEKEALSFEALFELVRDIPWEQILPRDAAFPVSGNCARSRLMSVSDCQSIAKKAIVERLKQRHKTQWFPETGPLFPISVTLHRDVARIAIDTSGEALSRRGFRTYVGEAPIRETLAAAMLRLSGWQADRPLHEMIIPKLIQFNDCKSAVAIGGSKVFRGVQQASNFNPVIDKAQINLNLQRC